MHILVKTAECIELCRGSKRSWGGGEGGSEECGWLSGPSSSTEELRNLRFWWPQHDTDLPGCPAWPVTLLGEIVWVVLLDWLSSTNTWNQTEKLFHNPSVGVVWVRVCGSSGNNEMLGCWNMRNHTNITVTFILFSIKREDVVCQCCVFIKMTPVLYVLKGKVRVHLYIQFNLKINN